MILRMFKSAIIVSTLLALGACQTTLSPGAVSKIQAAGYQPNTSTPSSVGPISGNAVYVCPASRCGKASAISVNTIQGNSNAAGETLEAQARKPGQSDSKVRSDFVRDFDTSSGSRKATSVRTYSTQSHAGLLLTGTGNTQQGKSVHFVGRVAFRGNVGTTVLGVGETPADARKAMNLALED
jgi:hypothetical protein